MGFQPKFSPSLTGSSASQLSLSDLGRREEKKKGSASVLVKLAGLQYAAVNLRHNVGGNAWGGRGRCRRRHGRGKGKGTGRIATVSLRASSPSLCCRRERGTEGIRRVKGRGGRLRVGNLLSNHAHR